MNYRQILALLFAFVTATYGYHCDRTPPRATKPRNVAEANRYVIELSGNPKNYVPGENYTIMIRQNPSERDKSVRHRFTEFTLVVEPENVKAAQDINTGQFGLFDPTISTFSTRCPNMVLQTNNLLKNSIQVWWVAPESGSGCLAIRATIYESPDTWFADDAELSKILCEDDSESEDKEPAVLSHCCACTEAKYEAAFQGIWSRNTHPKDFPTDIWRTRFSDIVGASHKLYNSFWSYGGIATTGLKLMAETGNTTELEEELKVKNENIRTIIKARELTYPNTTGTSYTVFRVDNDNHLVSLVSKLTPSPDWIVGVANFELCTKSCDWMESKSINLYPWDAGTKEGFSYTSDEGESQPQQFITRIRSNKPNREESPFFDEEGAPIKPLAKLTFTRQKVYEKECTGGQDPQSVEEVDPNCATTQWNDWSPCTDQCIRFRQRQFITPLASIHCTSKLHQVVACNDNENCQQRPSLSEDDSRCALGEWSKWSNCSAVCGKGARTRDRQFQRPEFANLCGNSGDLQETEECDGEGEDCPEGDQEEDTCPNTSWDLWSECSATCGTGLKERVRLSDSSLSKEDTDDEEEDTAVCANYKQVVECYNPPCDEDSNNAISGLPARNQIIDDNIVKTFVDGPVVHCKVSKWSVWSECRGGKPCKRGYIYKERHIMRHPQNGGKSCPKKLLKKKRCNMPCNSDPGDSNNNAEDTDTLPTWGPSEPAENIRIDCVMDRWSAWSPCSTNCGGSAVQIRTRGIKVYPSKNGTPCLNRKEVRKCPLPLSCSGGNFPYQF